MRLQNVVRASNPLACYPTGVASGDHHPKAVSDETSLQNTHATQRVGSAARQNAICSTTSSSCNLRCLRPVQSQRNPGEDGKVQQAGCAFSSFFRGWASRPDLRDLQASEDTPRRAGVFRSSRSRRGRGLAFANAKSSFDNDSHCRPNRLRSRRAERWSCCCAKEDRRTNLLSPCPSSLVKTHPRRTPRAVEGGLFSGSALPPALASRPSPTATDGVLGELGLLL